jgi:hypothetical protein
MAETRETAERARPTATIEIDGKKRVVAFGSPIHPGGGLVSGQAEELHENRDHQAIDKVEEGSEESFPASDPPSYNP